LNCASGHGAKDHMQVEMHPGGLRWRGFSAAQASSRFEPIPVKE
jgi:hypothetical protein